MLVTLRSTVAAAPNPGQAPPVLFRSIDSKRAISERPQVLKRLGHWLMIVALLGATGGHWAVLQTVAWTNMLANNLRTDSIAAALSKTFDGKNPCQLCKKISAGKKSERKTEFPTLTKKLEFVSGRAEFVFTAPEVPRLLSETNPSFATLTHQPPVPPPRKRLG